MDDVMIVAYVMIMDYVMRLLWVNIKSNQINKWLILPSKPDKKCLCIFIPFSSAVRFWFRLAWFDPYSGSCVTGRRQKR